MPNFSKALEIVEKAGKNLKPHFGKVKVKGYKEEVNAADIVTHLDEETEKFLKDELKRLDSSVGFKGEEFGAGGRRDRFWLADPIDGTGLFARGMSGCTVMLALIEEGKISFGAIYDFIADDMYYSKKGGGAFKNKEKIRVSKRRLKEAMLYFESKLINRKNLPSFLALDSSCIVLPGYPAGIHFAYTACGKIEGRVCQDPYGQDFDFAPGQLLVEEAGRVVKNLGMKDFDYTNRDFLAVNKEVYEDLTVGKNAIFSLTKVKGFSRID